MIPIGGQPWPVPAGLKVRSFLDDPKLRLGPGDRRPRRTRWVRSVILHTTWGIDPVIVMPGVGPNLQAEYGLVAHYNREAKHNGAHCGIDTDGSIGFFADVLDEVTYHAESINEVSIGIEIKQVPVKNAAGKYTGGKVWEAQLQAAALLVDTLCRALGIQRQFHAPYTKGKPVPRLVSGGADCVGVFGHRDQTRRKGPGDPGPQVFEMLAGLGFESFDFSKDHDRLAWTSRQNALIGTGLAAGLKADGIPGPATVRALRANHYPSGLWSGRTAP